MTRAEFEKWIDRHYEELVAVAFLRTRRDGARRGHDSGQAEARDAVQSAVARALDSPTLAVLEPAKAWPWMVDAVRSVVEHARRGAKRASKTHRQWAGAFLRGEGRHERGTWIRHYFEDDGTPQVVRSPRVVAVDRDQSDDENGHDFIGPRGAWRGEYTVAHIGPCSCGARGRHTDGATGKTYRHVGQSWSRLEVGRDRERLGYSKRWTVEALMAIDHAVQNAPANGIERLAGYALGCVVTDAASRTVHRMFQVLGCWNGHRTYTGEMP
jgi:DNA-directed RNA polymerase specialized sigma24 family protein